MFRGKESSNRIELSRLVQELLKFGVLGSLRLWGGGRWVGGVWGYLGAWGCPHMCACTCMHKHTHTCIELQMAASMEAYMFSMFNMHVHVCVHACACICAWDIPHTPIPTPTPIHPSATPQGVDPQNHLKFDNTSTYQDISIPFEDLKSVKNSPPMGGCVVWWVGGW